MRTSTMIGASGGPTRRASWATVIVSGAGIGVLSRKWSTDAMLWPKPHGAIAVGPMHAKCSRPIVRVKRGVSVGLRHWAFGCFRALARSVQEPVLGRRLTPVRVWAPGTGNPEDAMH